MSPRMMTQSAGRSTAAPRGGRTGGRTGRGGGRTGEPTGGGISKKFWSSKPEIYNNWGLLEKMMGFRGRDSRVGGRTGDQNGQGGDRGDGANGGVDEVPDFSTVIAQQLQNLLPTIIAQEFLACSPKDYDGNGGAIVYTRWTKKMESVHDMSGCGDNQKVKYYAGSFIGKALTWWNTQMPRTIPRLKDFSWSKVPPILVLSHQDLMSELRHPYEKNKLMYKNFLNLGPEYQLDDDMKEWLTRRHVSIHETT
ncbi:hypothetical protein Tco_0550323 [Tanacetum coccineum]